MNKKRIKNISWMLSMGLLLTGTLGGKTLEKKTIVKESQNTEMPVPMTSMDQDPLKKKENLIVAVKESKRETMAKTYLQKALKSESKTDLEMAKKALVVVNTPTSKKELVKVEQQIKQQEVKKQKIKEKKVIQEKKHEAQKKEVITSAKVTTSTSSTVSSSAKDKNIVKTKQTPIQNVSTKSVTPKSSVAPASVPVRKVTKKVVPPVKKQPTVPVKKTITNRIVLFGRQIPLVNTQGWGAAPSGNAAGYWQGNGITNDGAPTHIIGHNPGSFSSVMSLGVGSAIGVYDRNGNFRQYHVYRVMDINDEGYDRSGNDQWNTIFSSGGEMVSLQTCIDDFWNRIVLAR